jgi:hypothetical protein
MRILHTIIEYVRREPRGYSADGRTLGLGLAVAMEKANRRSTAQVEQFLRDRVDVPHQRAA